VRASTISQRDLRDDSGEILRRVEAGESFVVTRNGVPVGELTPVRKRQFVPAEVAVATFAGSEHIDYAGFRADVDAILDQDPTPNA
jgi:prevent-host-death family protein